MEARGRLKYGGVESQLNVRNLLKEYKKLR